MSQYLQIMAEAKRARAQQEAKAAEAKKARAEKLRELLIEAESVMDRRRSWKSHNPKEKKPQSETEKDVLQTFAAHPKSSCKQIALKLGLSVHYVQQIAQELRRQGKLVYNFKDCYWIVVEIEQRNKKDEF